MRALIIFLTVLSMSGCGVKHKVVGSAKVEMPQRYDMHIYLGIDPETIEAFEKFCVDQESNKNSDEVAECKKELIMLFLNAGKLQNEEESLEEALDKYNSESKE